MRTIGNNVPTLLSELGQSSIFHQAKYQFFYGKILKNQLADRTSMPGEIQQFILYPHCFIFNFFTHSTSDSIQLKWIPKRRVLQTIIYTLKILSKKKWT